MDDSRKGNDETDALKSLIAADTPNTKEFGIVHACDVTNKTPIDEELYEIYAMKLDYGTGSSEMFDGTCIDSAAQLTVIGHKQAEIYCMQIGKKYNPKI